MISYSDFEDLVFLDTKTPIELFFVFPFMFLVVVIIHLLVVVFCFLG